jgi:hypothetical protein
VPYAVFNVFANVPSSSIVSPSKFIDHQVVSSAANALEEATKATDIIAVVSNLENFIFSLLFFVFYLVFF